MYVYNINIFTLTDWRNTVRVGHLFIQFARIESLTILTQAYSSRVTLAPYPNALTIPPPTTLFQILNSCPKHIYCSSYQELCAQ